MDQLIASARKAVLSMGEARGREPTSAPEYLDWMITTVEKENGWPFDKRVRWLGFVVGSVDFVVYGPEGGATSCVDTMQTEVLFLGRKHETIIFPAIEEVLEGLESVCRTNGKTVGIDLVRQARQSPVSSLASFRLGYLQAYMTGWQIMDVDAERDRTRPIFHRAYAACGYSIPESRSKA